MNADRKTRKKMREVERHLTNEYFTAWEEMSAQLAHYTDGWNEIKDGKTVHHKGMFERYLEERAAFHAGAYGDPATKEAERAFRAWWAAQEGRRNYWVGMRDQFAERLTSTNQLAAAFVSENMPEVYAICSNGVANLAKKAAMDKGVLGIRFGMIDEYTVRNLIMNNKPPFKLPSVNIPKDQQWNRQKLQSALTQAILQGDDVKGLADRFQSVVNMNRSAAIRNARTSLNAARSAGKQDRMDDLAKQGCITMKKWVDVHDSIPPERPEHWEASGQEVPYDEPFIVGGEELMYPGDPAGSGWNIYNCRCEMGTGGFKFISVLDDKTRRKANIKVVG